MNAFETMRETAIGWLRKMKPETIARNAGIAYDPARQAFRMSTLGREVVLRLPEYRFAPELNSWQELTLLHCLHLADGFPLLNRPLSLGGMRDGAARGGSFDRRCEGLLGKLAALPEGEISRRCARLGGRRISGNADYLAVFELLPCCPLTLKLWRADEDFPASGRLLADGSIDHYLTVEDAVMLGGYIVETLLSE